MTVTLLEHDHLSTRISFVIKATKWCNLRCEYCYEFPYLSDKRRMSEEKLSCIFTKINNYKKSGNLDDFYFIWHGGEPFSLPAEFYENIRLLQKECFPDILVRNTVQTNLTTVSKRYKKFLLDSNFFKSIGISFDPFGGQRVTTSGKDSSDVFLKNLEWLTDTPLHRAGITVLSRKTLPYVQATYKFYDEMSIPVRFLPIYKSSKADQLADNELSGREILSAYLKLYEAWSSSTTATRVDPICRYIDYAINFIVSQSDKRVNSPFAAENMIIDLDGRVWSADDDYEDIGYFGNIFTETFEEVLLSPFRVKRNLMINQNIETYCGNCQYFGACPGEYIRYASTVQREVVRELGCMIKKFLDEIVPSVEKQIDIKIRNEILSGDHNEIHGITN